MTALDVKIFRVVNAIDLPTWASSILSVLARSHLWIAPIALGFVLLAFLGGPRERSYVVIALITLALTELIVSGLMKPLFARPRPCHVLEGVRLLGGCTSSFAMASGHAGNSFAQAVVVGLFYRPMFLISLPVASLVSLSRVIDGKHYPSDVVVGALVGIAVAIVLVRLLRTRLEAADRMLFRPHALVEKFALSETRESSRPALVFWSVLAVATAFRVWYVGWADLMPEEAVVWDRARFMRGRAWLSATPVEALAWGGQKWLGPTEYAVRLGALLASLLTSVLFYLWAKRAFPWSRWAGPLAGAGLLAVPAFAVGGAQLTPFTLSLLFWTGALASLSRISSQPGGKASWAWAAWGLCTGLALRTDLLSGLLLVPVSALFLVFTPRGTRRLKGPAPYAGLALALALGLFHWAFGAEGRPGPFGEAPPARLAAFLNWHLVHLGPIFLALLVWGVLWAARQTAQQGRREYVPLVWLSVLLTAACALWSWVRGIQPDLAMGAWVLAWMATVGAVTEIIRRKNRQSLQLFKALTLVLLLGVLQTTFLLNVRLLHKLGVPVYPKQDPAADSIGWRRLGQRVDRTLTDMGQNTLLLSDDRGTAAELSFYSRIDAKDTAPTVRVVNADGAPLRLPKGLEGRNALLVVVGERAEPPDSVRGVFRSWRREDPYDVKRRNSGKIRSVSLFRLYDYSGAFPQPQQSSENQR